MFIRNLIVTFVLTLLSYTLVSATHLRSGYIQVERINNSLTCKITLKVYTNTKNTTVKMGGDPDLSYLYFGDGERVFVPETDNWIRFDLDRDGSIAEATFVVQHTYTKENGYLINYSEPNRNAGVINMDNSVNTLFYVETYIHLTSGFVASPSPVLDPVFIGTAGNDFSGALTTTDAFDDVWHRYSLITPMKSTGVPVDNYRLPTNASINAINGVMTWDSNLQDGHSWTGEFSFAVKTTQSQNDGTVLSYTLIDFQVIILDAASFIQLSDNRELDNHNRIYAGDGAIHTIRVFAEDSEGAEIVFLDSTILKDNAQFPGAYTFTAYDSAQGSRKIWVGLITYQILPGMMMREHPYSFIVRASNSSVHEYAVRDVTYMIYTSTLPPIDPNDPTTSTEPEAVVSQAYPNPVSDELHIDWTGVRSINLYGPGGNIVHQSSTPTPTIDFSNMGAGIYILKYQQTNHKNRVAKIVKY